MIKKRKPRPDVVLRNKSAAQRKAVSESHKSGARDESYIKISKSVSKSLIGKTGDQARRWKGQDASYHPKHAWIRKHHGKATKCLGHDCSGKSLTYQWALLKGRQYSHNIDDYIMLCASCHKKYDLHTDRLP